MSNLQRDIRSFCDRHRVAPSSFGQMALNDKAFVFQVEKGRRVWPETEARVRAFMAKYRSHSTTPAPASPAQSSLTAAESSPAGGKVNGGSNDA